MKSEKKSEYVRVYSVIGNDLNTINTHIQTYFYTAICLRGVLYSHQSSSIIEMMHWEIKMFENQNNVSFFWPRICSLNQQIVKKCSTCPQRFQFISRIHLNSKIPNHSRYCRYCYRIDALKTPFRHTKSHYVNQNQVRLLLVQSFFCIFLYL